ncbi:MAG: xanthine dehydrogenase family protein subunit M [Chloroflexi bacterium]|nr:xanthine dehydrogenase family protein subunit M [Chloroflexota bacterium]
MARFDYLEPHSVDEALQMLAEHGDKTRLVAGSTDFLVRWRTGVWRPESVVCMQHVPGLDYINWNPDDGLSIGAMASVQDIELNTEVRSRYPALAAGATSFAGVQVRNLATVAGNICNASPAGDTLPALLAYNAQCRIIGPSGERSLPLDELFVGPGRTALAAGEILTEIRLPPPAPNTGGLYIKHSPRGAMDISAVGVASVVSLNDDGTCASARIALGSVAPTPLRAYGAEGRLVSQTPDAANIAEAARLASQSCNPIADVRSGADYRREMVRVLTERTLQHGVATAGDTPSFDDIRRLAVQTAW